MRYKSELRYFDEFDDDYIHLVFDGQNRSSAYNKAYNHHRKHYYYEKCKINVFDMKHPEHNEWCVESSIVNPYGKRN